VRCALGNCVIRVSRLLLEPRGRFRVHIACWPWQDGMCDEPLTARPPPTQNRSLFSQSRSERGSMLRRWCTTEARKNRRRNNVEESDRAAEDAYAFVALRDCAWCRIDVSVVARSSLFGVERGLLIDVRRRAVSATVGCECRLNSFPADSPVRWRCGIIKE
jgi:hypothetical protein